jgi:hypothetical protein
MYINFVDISSRMVEDDEDDVDEDDQVVNLVLDLSLLEI